MQHGSLAMVSRKEGPAVWQFRWSEKGLCGVRVQRKRVISTIERYPNETAARSAVVVLLAQINRVVRPEMGRHLVLPRNDERNAIRSFMVSLVRARPNRRKSRYLFIRLFLMHFWWGENNQLTRTGGGIHSGDKPFYEDMFDRLPRRSESRNALAGTRFVIPIRRSCEVWALNSKSCRSCCVTQRCGPHWMSIPRRSRQPNMQRRQPCCHWFFRMELAEARSRRYLVTPRRDQTSRRRDWAKKDTKKGMVCLFRPAPSTLTMPHA